MSKYIKLDDAIHNINLEVTGRKEYTGDMKANLFFALDDLPTIEVSEDGEDYLRGYNDGWYAHEVITNAKLHIDKPRGFTLRTEKGYGNYSEDCISREYILGEAFMSDEYNRETKSFDLPVVSVEDIKDAPSVVPSRAEGEWYRQTTDQFDYWECSECGMGVGLDDIKNYCPNCGAKMKG